MSGATHAMQKMKNVFGVPVVQPLSRPLAKYVSPGSAAPTDKGISFVKNCMEMGLAIRALTVLLVAGSAGGSRGGSGEIRLKPKLDLPQFSSMGVTQRFLQGRRGKSTEGPVDWCSTEAGDDERRSKIAQTSHLC